jgi:hypothetical protein
MDNDHDTKTRDLTIDNETANLPCQLPPSSFVRQLKDIQGRLGEWHKRLNDSYGATLEKLEAYRQLLEEIEAYLNGDPQFLNDRQLLETAVEFATPEQMRFFGMS